MLLKTPLIIFVQVGETKGMSNGPRRIGKVRTIVELVGLKLLRDELNC
jgi:hypothetical protein